MSDKHPMKRPRLERCVCGGDVLIAGSKDTGWSAWCERVDWCSSGVKGNTRAIVEIMWNAAQRASKKAKAKRGKNVR